MSDSMLEMLSKLASDSSVSADKFELILKMKASEESGSGEKAYIKAMVSVQAEIPAITKDKNNPQTHSKFASVEAIKKIVTPVYTKHGFALSFGEGIPAKEGDIRVTCDVMHEEGHVKHYFYDCPIDDKGIQGKANKTETHGKASGVSYGERYLLKLIFNLAIQDEDDDGNYAGNQLILEDQIDAIEALLLETQSDKDRFFKSYGINSVGGLPAEKYNEVVTILNKKLDQL